MLIYAARLSARVNLIFLSVFRIDFKSLAVRICNIECIKPESAWTAVTRGQTLAYK